MPDEMRLPRERLVAYQVAMDLLAQVRELRVVDPRLRDQMSRASKSVCLNIAEAVGRLGDGDKRRVYAIARGECCEVAAAIDIAMATGECERSEGAAARASAGRLYALLTGLVRRCDLNAAGPKTSPSNDNAAEIEHQNENERQNQNEH